MRRSLFFGLLSLILAALAWWFWPSRHDTAEQNANTNKPATNFSTLQSSAFEPDGQIPKKYSCDGENINPPLLVGSLPPTVKYFSVVLDDPDARSGVFDHWVVWDIPRRTGTIEENLAVGIVGKNSDRKEAYFGPCPPDGEHRYRFRIWGYTSPLDLPAGSTKRDLLEKLDGSAVVTAELFGRFSSQ